MSPCPYWIIVLKIPAHKTQTAFPYSRMTRIPQSSFSQMLVRLNRLDRQGFKRWVLQPGMEFATRNTWWEDNGKRATPHEGLDFCCFADRSGGLVNLNEKTLVPAMYDGTVVKMIKDFLGISIVLEHGFQDRDKRLYSVYAHIFAAAGLVTGSRVKAGKPIATICATGKKVMRSHLHLSVAWADEAAVADLTWQNINDTDRITLCNPLDFLDISSS